MKKKNGFTLIELIATMALMLSILGIAIVSLIGISSANKKEAWQQIKQQVETAAVEYFTANEYLFEDMSDNVDAYISVGKLVEEDYINKITNPVTGKSVNYCTKIKVTKNGNKLNANYSDEVATNCNGTYTINIIEPGAPSIEPSYYKENGDEAKANSRTKWYNAENLGEKKSLNVCMKISPAGGKIVEAKIGKEVAKKNDKLNSNQYRCVTYLGDSGDVKNIKFVVKNQAGKYAKLIVNSIKIDSYSPDIKSLKLTSENSYIRSDSLDSQVPENLDLYTGYNNNNSNSNKSNNNNKNNNKNTYTLLTDVQQLNKVIDENKSRNEKLTYDREIEKNFIYDDNTAFKFDYKHLVDSGVIRKLKNNIGLNNKFYHGDYNYYVLHQVTLPSNVKESSNVYGCVYCWEYYGDKKDTACRNYNNENVDCFKLEGFYLKKVYGPSSINFRETLRDTLYNKDDRDKKIIDLDDIKIHNIYKYVGKLNGKLATLNTEIKEKTSGIDKVESKSNYYYKEDSFNLFDKYSIIDNSYTSVGKYYYEKATSSNKKILYKFSKTRDENERVRVDDAIKYNNNILNNINIKYYKRSELLVDNLSNNKTKDIYTISKKHVFFPGELNGSTTSLSLTVYDKAGNKSTAKTDYKKYKNCLPENLQEETNMVGSTSCDNSVCNSYGTEIVTRTYQKYYKDKNSGAFCGNIGDPWYENDYYPNSSHCNYKSCTQPAVTTTTTKTTTTAKKKPTKSCDWSKVKISFSVSNANKDHCYAVGESVTKEKDATSFKVKFSYPSDFEKKDTHAAFCNDKNTCKSVKESNPGQTSVVCTNSTKCYENYKYVGASIELKCGKTTRTIYGSASIKDVKK